MDVIVLHGTITSVLLRNFPADAEEASYYVEIFLGGSPHGKEVTADSSQPETKTSNATSCRELSSINDQMSLAGDSSQSGPILDSSYD